MMEPLVPAQKAPDLNIPKSDTTVKVSAIDATCRLKIPMGPFLQPDFTGHPYLTGPCIVFLIEHPKHKPILFDLGVRKDWEKYPSYPKWVELNWGINVEKDVATILKENGRELSDIENIIWSHHHWDHVGDPSTFPSSTGLVIGPGFQEAYMPGYPKREDSTLLETDFESRDVREISFEKEGNGLKIGRFDAYDYFRDGSFYLLSTPGHSIGHMCGFARTTADTFVFMGGDASHHGGEFKPNIWSPLPKELSPSPMKRRAGGICPGHLLQEVHPEEKADKPFYNVTESFAHHKPTADWTIEGLGEFDAHDNVLMLIAHDDEVLDPPQFELYPKSMNDWHEKKMREKIRWRFLGDFEDAVEAKEKGEKAFAWGKYP